MSLRLSDHKVLHNIASSSSIFDFARILSLFSLVFGTSKLSGFKEFNKTIIPFALVGYETGYSYSSVLSLFVVLIKVTKYNFNKDTTAWKVDLSHYVIFIVSTSTARVNLNEGFQTKGPFLESPETLRAIFGCHNSFCISRTERI